MSQPIDLLEDITQYNAGLLEYFKFKGIEPDSQNQSRKDGFYFAKIMDVLILRNNISLKR